MVYNSLEIPHIARDNSIFCSTNLIYNKNFFGEAIFEHFKQMRSSIYFIYVSYKATKSWLYITPNLPIAKTSVIKIFSKTKQEKIDDIRR